MRYLVKKMENAAVRCTTTFNLFYSSNCFVYLLTVQATCGLFSYDLELCFFTSKSYTKYHVTMIQLLTPKQTRAGESAGACVFFRYHSCLWTQHCQYNYLLIIFFRLSFHFQISGLEKKKKTRANTEAIPLSVSESKFTSHAHTDAHKSQKKKGRKQKKRKSRRKRKRVWFDCLVNGSRQMRADSAQVKTGSCLRLRQSAGGQVEIHKCKFSPLKSILIILL